MDNYKRFLKDEEERDLYARAGKLDLLKRLYKLYKKSHFPKDLNAAAFWDKKTAESHSDLLVSPVYKDKIVSVCTMLKQAHGKLLDVGFGYGDLERCLARIKPDLDLFGIDISSVAVKKIRERITGTYLEGNVLNIPFKTSSFNFVTALDILEHIPPQRTFKAIGEISRVLKGNGVLIISVPLNEGIDRLLAGGKNPNAHLRLYTPDLLKAELYLSGFSVFEEKYFYAFKNFYLFKKIILRFLPLGFREPNLIVVKARKK